MAKKRRTTRRTHHRSSSGVRFKPLYQIAMVGGGAILAAGAIRAVGDILD